MLYCKFWELDTDHDFLLSRADLARLKNLTPCTLDRVHALYARSSAPAGSALAVQNPSARLLGYEDFVCFFMASEDKTNPSALR